VRLLQQDLSVFKLGGLKRYGLKDIRRDVDAWSLYKFYGFVLLDDSIFRFRLSVRDTNAYYGLALIGAPERLGTSTDSIELAD
jgi:hypothetical protein